jgi:predicted DsbA family dithiol-disulfide isomerase
MTIFAFSMLDSAETSANKRKHAVPGAQPPRALQQVIDELATPKHPLTRGNRPRLSLSKNAFAIGGLRV